MEESIKPAPNLRTAVPKKSSLRKPQSAKPKPKPDPQKRREVEELVQRRQQAERRAFEIVMQFVEGEASELMLQQAAKYIDPNHYDDIVTERSIGKLCGFPLCSRELPNTMESKKFHIDTRTNRLYDITERKNFCSNNCYAASCFYKNQLSPTPVWLREGEVREEVKVLNSNEISGLIGKPVNVFGSDVPDMVRQMKQMDLASETASESGPAERETTASSAST